MIRALAYFLFMLTLFQDGNLTDVCSIIPRYVTESRERGKFGIFCQLRVKPWGNYVADCCRCSEIKRCFCENIWGIGYWFAYWQTAFCWIKTLTPYSPGHWNKQSVESRPLSFILNARTTLHSSGINQVYRSQNHGIGERWRRRENEKHRQRLSGQEETETEHWDGVILGGNTVYGTFPSW